LLEKLSKKQILFCLDRSHGGASIHDGSIEVMVHRRILTNDPITHSLAEPLNETAYGQGLVVRGKHLLIIDTPNNSALVHRTNAQQLYMQPISTFALTNLPYANYSASYRQTWSALVDAMPRNLHLLTLDQLAPKQYLVRVEHYFELREDATYSQPIQIDLQQLFHSFGQIQDFTELILTANMPLAEMNRLNWTTTENESSHWNAMGEFLLRCNTFVIPLLIYRTSFITRHANHP
jgi:lysosomal alpha-mannosidase